MDKKNRKKVEKGKIDPIHLFIGIPARGSVSIQWTIALIEMMRALNWGTKIMSTDEIPLTRARNRIVRTFMDSKSTHLLWIDSDTMPPPGGVHKLFQYLKPVMGDTDPKRFDIISGLYFSRKKSGWFRPIAFQKLDTETKKHNHVYMWGKKPFKVDAIGMGFCIIPRYVFEHLEVPYYQWISDPSWGYWKEDEGSLSFGEDMYFSEKARGAGFTIGVHPLVQCGHIGETNITGNDYMDQIRLGRFGTEQLLGAISTGDKLLNPEQKKFVAELVNYTGLSMKQVIINLANGRDLVRNRWLNVKPRSPREIYDFYTDCSEYIYDLGTFNYFTGTQIELVDRLARESNGRILDYGAGIGAYLIRCWELGKHDVTHYDVPGPVLDFARWRYKQRGMEVTVVEAPFDVAKNDPLGGYFDTVTCIDTLEHLEDPVTHLEQIGKHFDIHRKENIFHVNMSAPDKDHPMHIRHKLRLDEMLKQVFGVSPEIKR